MSVHPIQRKGIQIKDSSFQSAYNYKMATDLFTFDKLHTTTKLPLKNGMLSDEKTPLKNLQGCDFKYFSMSMLNSFD